MVRCVHRTRATRSRVSLTFCSSPGWQALHVMLTDMSSIWFWMPIPDMHPEVTPDLSLVHSTSRNLSNGELCYSRNLHIGNDHTRQVNGYNGGCESFVSGFRPRRHHTLCHVNHGIEQVSIHLWGRMLLITIFIFAEMMCRSAQTTRLRTANSEPPIKPLLLQKWYGRSSRARTRM